MSCDKCVKTPATRETCFDRMADGRQFTNWTPNCILYWNQKDIGQMNSSYDQRIFMINNAEKLMQDQRNTLPGGTCVPCFTNNEQGTVLPELESQMCNSKFCQFSTVNDSGVGLGRNFSS
jgi:hypothetical protein